MSSPYEPDQPAQPQSQSQSPPPWQGGPAVPPPAPAGAQQQPYAGYHQPQPDPVGQHVPSPAAPKKRPWVARHKILTGLGALVLIGAIGSAMGGGSSDPKPVAAATEDADGLGQAGPLPSDQIFSSPPATTAAPAATTTAKPAPKPPAPPAEPKLTKSQEQAIGSAEDYLKLQAFSKLGLIQQLSSSAGEGFSRADATFAVNHLDVNWKEQAVLSAKEYLQLQHFSRAGLIQQLSSSAGEQFTRAEATYAADKVGL